MASPLAVGNGQVISLPESKAENVRISFVTEQQWKIEVLLEKHSPTFTLARNGQLYIFYVLYVTQSHNISARAK